MTSPETPEEISGSEIDNTSGVSGEEAKPAPVHHSVWSFGAETPRQAFLGTGTGWASSFFPPSSITPGAGGAPGPREKGGSVESVLNTLEHKIALLQQDLAHSWGHLNEWKKGLASEQSEIAIRAQDLDNREKMINELTRELRQRDEIIRERETEIERLDRDLEARLSDLGHAEVVTMVRNLEQREREVQRFAAQYDGKRAELEEIKHTAEQNRRQAEADRRTAEELHADLGQRGAEVSRREHELEDGRADLQHLRQRLQAAQQQLARKEQVLAERQTRLERLAEQMQARWSEMCENEHILKQRGEALQRFGDYLQDAIDACDGPESGQQPDRTSRSDTRRAGGSAPQGAAAAHAASESLRRARRDMDTTVKAIERETRSVMREFSSQNDVPLPTPQGEVPATDATADHVRAADSLNTHLFRRIRHNRAQGQGRGRGAESEGGNPAGWWES